MASDQEFCLRWNNHQSTLVSVFDRLLSSEVMTDVTLAAEGRSIKAHRLVLSACSPFFQDVLNTNPDKHMVIFLKDVPFDELRALVNYMYKGEVSVAQDKLTSLIRIAENLKVRGLAEPDEAPSKKLPPLPKLTPAVIKREPTPQRASTPPSTKKRKKAAADPPPLQPAVVPPAEEVEEHVSKNEGQSLLEKSLLMPREINANHVDYTPAAGPSFHLKKEEINMESADEAEEGDDWSGPEGEEPSGSWPEQNDSIGENPGENSTQDVLLQVSPPRKRYLKTEGYKCEVCNKIYKYPNNLTRHRRTECGVEPSMKCFYCPKMFSRKDKLRDHLNKCHTKEIMEALMHYSNPTEVDEVGNNNNI